MRYIVLAVIATALIAVPISARADDATSAAQGGAPPGLAIMEQAHAKMEQLHAQARLSMLSAISPAHRALLAQVVGEVAIAQTPDLAAAARTLDASLTPSEAKSIVSISASLEQQARQVMDAARKQMEASMPGGGPGNAPYGMQGMHAVGGPPGGRGVYVTGGPGWQAETDPGMILLSMVGRTLGPGKFHIGLAPPGTSR